MTILNRTLNFYDLYLHCMGKSEVPHLYHYWSCVSLLSAVLEDRVWYEFYKDDPLYPNLYVMLIGESANCKGLAVGSAYRLAQAAGLNTHTHRGPVTAPFLLDKLAGKVPGTNVCGDHFEGNSATMWLVMDELAHDVDAGSTAMTQRFLKMMTELYTGHYPMDTGTRTSGIANVNNPCVTWLSGTTESWLKKVLTRDMVDSGFTPRVLPVVAPFEDNREPWVEYPADRDLVYDHLKSRLYTLKCITGGFVLSEAAEREYETWYRGKHDKFPRETPDDPIVRAFWRRERALMFKLAMISAVMDPGPLVITSYHIRKALHHTRYAMTWHNMLVDSASATPDTEDIDVVREVIVRWKELEHVKLLNLVKRKMNTFRCKRAMGDLIQCGDVEQLIVGPRGKIAYKWIGD